MENNAEKESEIQIEEEVGFVLIYKL